MAMKIADLTVVKTKGMFETPRPMPSANKGTTIMKFGSIEVVVQTKSSVVTFVQFEIYAKSDIHVLLGAAPPGSTKV